MSVGVPAGATTPSQNVLRNLGKPASAVVGTSGCFGLRFAKAGAASVTIVEEGTAACRDAEHNARANRSPNVTVVASPFATAPLPDRPDLLVSFAELNELMGLDELDALEKRFISQ